MSRKLSLASRPAPLVAVIMPVQLPRARFCPIDDVCNTASNTLLCSHSSATTETADGVDHTIDANLSLSTLLECRLRRAIPRQSDSSVLMRDSSSLVRYATSRIESILRSSQLATIIIIYLIHMIIGCKPHHASLLLHRRCECYEYSAFLYCRLHSFLAYIMSHFATSGSSSKHDHSSHQQSSTCLLSASNRLALSASAEFLLLHPRLPRHSALPLIQWHGSI